MVGTWTFAELPPDLVKRDPFEAEFFVGEEESEEVYGRTDGLVREVIQNALDARVEGGPARVRFALHEPEDAPSRERLEAYFGGLRPHLVACGLDALGGRRGAAMPRFRWSPLRGEGL